MFLSKLVVALPVTLSSGISGIVGYGAYYTDNESPNCLWDGTCYRINGVGGYAYIRSANNLLSSSGESNIEMTYYLYYDKSGDDGNCYLDWYDGSIWYEVRELNATGSKSPGVFTFPSGADDNPDLQIRFRTDSTDTKDVCWIDQIDVYVSPTAAPTTTPPTTASPTTASPTTAVPTTSQPTTINPTTTAPTTSTAFPTTSQPTTIGPTTAAPTTSDPTTHNPTTTAMPTSAAPTTASPTTLTPTTTAPTTSSPTSYPITMGPTTSNPTTVTPTADPITSSPTAIPSTAVPTTNAPTNAPSNDNMPTTPGKEAELASTTNSDNADSIDDGHNDSDGLTVVQYLCIAIGVLALLCIITAIFFYRERLKRKDESSKHNREMNSLSVSSNSVVNVKSALAKVGFTDNGDQFGVNVSVNVDVKIHKISKSTPGDFGDARTDNGFNGKNDGIIRSDSDTISDGNNGEESDEVLYESVPRFTRGITPHNAITTETPTNKMIRKTNTASSIELHTFQLAEWNGANGGESGNI